MGLYGENKDYEELFRDNATKARILYEIPEENRDLAIEYLRKRDEILKKNGFFTSFELKRIDKKINKLKQNK